MRSTLELTSDWKPSIAVIRLLTEFFVMADRLDIEDVEEFDDFVLLEFPVLAFLLVVVAISVGGARLDWKVETESSSVHSFTNTCHSPKLGLLSSCFTTMSRSISSSSAIDSSASVVTVPVFLDHTSSIFL